ncbi:MAG: hypothetical protein COW89_08250 [Nitrospinae bacterium CG22_combo_CG10-13_8_21_14_all_47_10]|nr:MAG: hypothetical protein COW89_08250 [Nitrospinae bacterium CG22_combo_CG10-13_8_21_14_all_47_10]
MRLLFFYAQEPKHIKILKINHKDKNGVKKQFSFSLDMINFVYTNFVPKPRNEYQGKLCSFKGL